MKININIKNSSIHFQNQIFEYRDQGITLVRGINGSGKTTIMREIVFNQLPRINDYRCTYIEQEAPVFECKIKHYLTRFNPYVNETQMIEYLELFRLNELNLNSEISILSGGELTKLNIISGLLKESDVIFMDEPTNNLDDESVETLLSICESLSLNKAIVMITHDERVVSKEYEEVHIEEGRITSPEVNSPTLLTSNHHNPIPKYPTFKILKDFSLQPFMFSLNITLVLILMAMIMVNDFMIQLYFPLNENEKSNYIVLEGWGEDYSFRNEYYARERGIHDQIDHLRYTQIITYADLKQLYERDDIKNIYFSVDDNFWSFFIKRSEETHLNEINVFSAPLVYTQNAKNVDTFHGERVLLDGKIPEDGKKEVMISIGLLKKNFPNIDTSNPINQQIEINGEIHTIVGIGMSDIAVISYEEHHEHSIAKYFPGKSDKLIERILDNLSQYERIFPETPDIVFIEGHKDLESLTDDLVMMFPGNVPYGYYHSVHAVKGMQRPYLRAMFLANIAFSLVLSLGLFISNVKNFKRLKMMFRFYDNYYVRSNHTFNLLRLSYLMFAVSLIMTAYGVTLSISKYTSLHTATIASLNMAIITIPLAFSMKLQGK